MLVKDLVSKNTKKMDKSIKVTNRNLEKTEVQAKETSKEILKMGQSFSKVDKISARQAQKANKGGGGGRGGGKFGGSFAAIPIIGGVLAAAFASVNKVSSAFIQGSAVNQEIK